MGNREVMQTGNGVMLIPSHTVVAHLRCLGFGPEVL